MSEAVSRGVQEGGATPLIFLHPLIDHQGGVRGKKIRLASLDICHPPDQNAETALVICSPSIAPFVLISL